MLCSNFSIFQALLSRDKFDYLSSSSIRTYNSRKAEIPTISAVIRVKNGGEYIESSILSIAPLVTEIILVDNQSSDNTREIVERLSNELKYICDIKYFTYNKKLALAGEGYLNQVSSKQGASLADYYNYCFSLATCDYVLKWDAHIIMYPHAIAEIQRKISQKKYDAIKFRGVEVYGKLLSPEIRLYRHDDSIRYIDSEHYEIVDFSKRLKIVSLFKPVHLHIKRLSYVKYINKSDSAINEKYK